MRNSVHPCLRALWIGGLLALGLATAASAGVSIVDDGSAGGPAKILVRSAIRRGDRAALERALDQVSLSVKGRINGAPFVTVELDSPGGDVVEAIGMGRAINQHLAMTLVQPGRECVSACVFILMAGAVHTPLNGAEIGVHRPMLVTWSSNIDSRRAHELYDGLMAYLRDYFRALGISDEAYGTMMGTDSFGMHYFTSGEMDAAHLRGEGPAWQSYFAARQAAASTPTKTSDSAQATPPQIAVLPPVPESYRRVVFMPGAYRPGEDYFAGTDIRPAHFIWDSLDDGAPGLRWDTPNVAAFVALLAHAVRDAFQPIWWLVLVLLFELVRGVYLPWPGLDPDSRWRDRWRLKPLR